MNYISKVVSKLYAVENGSNVVVAEVIENPGCGFDYLVRVKPKYKYNLNVFVKIIELCGLPYFDVSMEVIDKSINDGYLYKNENIAFIVDEII
jgi:hypothetical protein